MGDNCTQVVIVTAEPHTLTLNRTRGTTLLGGREGGRDGGGGGRVGKDMKVSGYGGYEGVCNSILVYERGKT